MRARPFFEPGPLHHPRDDRRDERRPEGRRTRLAETAGARVVIEDANLRRLVDPEASPSWICSGFTISGSPWTPFSWWHPLPLHPILRVVRGCGVPMEEVGYVEEGRAESVLRMHGEDRDFSPRFRESAYTPVKKVVDRRVKDFKTMKRGVDRAAEAALAKKKRVLSSSGRRPRP